jgi:hypothetical protein
MPVTSPNSVIKKEKGRIEIIHQDKLQALSWSTLKFRWTLGFDVEPGGGMEIILLTRFPTNRWSLPQINDPTAPGYVTASAKGDALLILDILRWPLLQKPHGPTLHVIQLGVGGRTLKKGEVVEVTYGDKRGGSLGVQTQAIAREVSFPVFVSSGQQPKFFERFVSWGRQTDIATLREKSDFNPSVRVLGGKASSFFLAAPMEIEPGKPFDMHLSVLDIMCNAANGYKGFIEISTTDQNSNRVHTTHIESSKATIKGVVLNTPGFHRIYALDPDHVIVGVSNPIRVIKDAKKIFWGEIHGHSESSDGNGKPGEHYTYARDVALLDFACVCDHDKSLYAHPERWNFAKEKVKEYSKPGEFIAILGYEGRMRAADKSEYFGDINVYYLKSAEEMLDPFPVPLPLDITKGKDVILIPHSPLYGKPETQMGTHWEFLKEIPANVMPLVEIFSTHGNSEYYDCPRHVLWQAKAQSVLNALKNGFRLGFIGSSDYHEVLTGSMLRIQDTPRAVNHQHMQARGGLAAVRAEELSRSSLFYAMKTRKTFATSGIRAYIDFSINDHEMGAEFTILSASEPRRLNIAAAAPEHIVKLEVIRNGEVIADLADGNWYVESEIVDSDEIPNPTFYYLRATTERTDFIWSSPIWVDIYQS